MTPVIPNPAASAQPAPGAGQPPAGSSPATGPTQNMGYQAAGMAKLALVVKGLESILPMFGAGSEPGQDILESIKRLSKHVPPGAVTPAAQNNAMQSMMLKQAQAAPMMAAQRAVPQQAPVQQTA